MTPYQTHSIDGYQFTPPHEPILEKYNGRPLRPKPSAIKKGTRP